MIHVFLSYARRDGLDAATKLRGELTAAATIDASLGLLIGPGGKPLCA